MQIYNKLTSLIKKIDVFISKKISYRYLNKNLNNEFSFLFNLLINNIKCRTNIDINIKDRKVWVEIMQGLYIQYSDKYNSISSIILRDGDFEHSELNIILNNLRDDAVMFDIRANIGLYSISAAKKYKYINIHAFEPVPETIKELEENIIKNNVKDKIKINSMAITDKDEYVFITTDYHSSNYITNKNSKEKTIKVPATSIDNYIRKNKISKLDICKIDVEGKELGVLLGMKETLRHLKPIIMLEIIEKPDFFLDRNVDDYKQTIKQLTEFGYKYYVLDDNDNFIKKNDTNKNNTLKKSFHNYLFYHPNKQPAPVIEK